MSAVLAPISQDKSIEACVHEWMQAKGQEDAAKARRLALEDRILALAPPLEEGSQTTKLDNGFKLTTTGKLAYKCDDVPGLVASLSTWPQNLVPVKTTLTLDEAGCKYLRKHEPEMWRELAKHVSVAPAKTAVKVAV